MGEKGEWEKNEAEMESQGGNRAGKRLSEKVGVPPCGIVARVELERTSLAQLSPRPGNLSQYPLPPPAPAVH